MNRETRIELSAQQLMMMLDDQCRYGLYGSCPILSCCDPMEALIEELNKSSKKCPDQRPHVVKDPDKEMSLMDWDNFVRAQG